MRVEITWTDWNLKKNFIIELRIEAMARGHIPIRSFVSIQNYWINPKWIQSKMWSNL